MDDVAFRRFVELFVDDVEVGFGFVFVLAFDGCQEMFDGFAQVALNAQVMRDMSRTFT